MMKQSHNEELSLEAEPRKAASPWGMILRNWQEATMGLKKRYPEHSFLSGVSREEARVMDVHQDHLHSTFCPKSKELV
jgi:hypothetical protein